MCYHLIHLCEWMSPKKHIRLVIQTTHNESISKTYFFQLHRHWFAAVSEQIDDDLSSWLKVQPWKYLMKHWSICLCSLQIRTLMTKTLWMGAGPPPLPLLRASPAAGEGAAWAQWDDLVLPLDPGLQVRQQLLQLSPGYSWATEVRSLIRINTVDIHKYFT